MADPLKAVAAELMSKLVGVKNERGEFLADRMSVSDLWQIIEITVPVVRTHLVEEIERLSKSGDIPTGLSPDEALVWGNRIVREHIVATRKINAIKEARTISGMSLKEAKETVEKMEATYKASGGIRWVL